MKQKWINYLAGAVILLLIAANIFQFHRSAACQNDLKVKEQIISDIGINTQYSSFLESNWQWNLTSERLDLSQVYVADTLGNHLSLGEIIREPVLAFRFHETDCQDCVSFGLRKLEAFSWNKPLILGQYHDDYSFKRWSRTTNTRGIKSFNLSESLPPDKMAMPCFFVIHPDLTLGELFIPDKSNPQLTDRYLKTIAKKYFTKMPHRQ